MRVIGLEPSRSNRMGDADALDKSTTGFTKRSLQGLTEQAFKIGRRTGARIGLVANIGLGNLH